MLVPAPPYADYPARLLTLQAQATRAYAAHAARPHVQGAFDEYLKRWVAAYAVRAALAEQNPAWAGRLLPLPGDDFTPPLSTSLPLVPASGRWVVDEAGPDTLTLTINTPTAPGTLSLQVLAPGASVPVVAGLVVGPAQTTSTFAAPADGIYTLTLAAGGTYLATLYVPVCRAEYRLLREDVRALAFDFHATLPRPSPTLLSRLARLEAAEAACRTGQPTLAVQVLASARALPPAPAPPALFPSPRHA